ncbi:MAG TPA: class II aldolase [Rhodospirillaceae bacterium]|nr:class II aldolase [Rhodospirillaceae bacterium]HAA93769.1 class II aldolase [Rhodospirillaceae bacterium]HAT34565.1 class II aldolase [Rhodospirillaceae bacterium]
MTVVHAHERRELIHVVQEMNRLGINQGKAGNASVRIDQGLLITPGGVDYAELELEDIVEMDFDGNHRCLRADRVPSSEWRFHCDILKTRDDLGAIVHTHGKAATALACVHREIPAFHYLVGLAGGNSIRCAPYALFGTQALSDHALKALEGRKACLLANHGMIVADTTLTRALALAVEVETLAEMYARALQVGEPVLLTDAEMAEVLEKFAEGYGVAAVTEPVADKG